MEIFHGLKFKNFIENAIKKQKELDESYQQSKRNKKRTNYIRKITRIIRANTSMPNVR